MPSPVSRQIGVKLPDRAIFRSIMGNSRFNYVPLPTYSVDVGILLSVGDYKRAKSVVKQQFIQHDLLLEYGCPCRRMLLRSGKTEMNISNETDKSKSCESILHHKSNVQKSDTSMTIPQRRRCIQIDPYNLNNPVLSIQI